MKRQNWRSTNPAFLVFALWGICKFAAGQNPLLPIQMFDQPGSKPELVDQQVALILELMCLGVVQRHEASQSLSHSPTAGRV